MRRPPVTRSTRKKIEPAPLSERRIVDAALSLIQREGAEQLSMRALAADLGVTPMALYYYVGNKDELLERAADAVLAQVPRPAVAPERWKDGLREAALQGFSLLRQYPGLSAHIIHRPPTKQTEALAQYGVSLMVQAGFEPGIALQATIVCQTFVFGMIGVQAQLERTPQAGQQRAGEASRLVELGLDALTSGFDTWLREDTARTPPKKPRRKTPARATSSRR